MKALIIKHYLKIAFKRRYFSKCIILRSILSINRSSISHMYSSSYYFRLELRREARLNYYDSSYSFDDHINLFNSIILIVSINRRGFKSNSEFLAEILHFIIKILFNFIQPKSLNFYKNFNLIVALKLSLF